MTNFGSATYWSILMVVAFIAAGILFGLWPQGENFEEATGLVDSELWAELKSRTRKISGEVNQDVKEGLQKASEFVTSEIEKQAIDSWLTSQNLNKYGDDIGTFYTGGTPLFNEQTGETIDRYDYLLQKFSDKPWTK
jgi:hypothetical protein